MCTASFHVLLLSSILTTQVTTAMVPGSVNGSVGPNGFCHCTVNYPDLTFPVDRVEQLEMLSVSLSTTVERELTKIQEFASKLSIHEHRMQNLTFRVETMENNVASYSELDFELLKLEIRQMESLTNKMKATVADSNGIIEQLSIELKNMTLAITKLEKFDKNNVLAIRREVAALKRRLEECQETRNQTNPTQPPIVYGSCNHGLVSNISEPFVVQLNWRGFGYKAGAWGRDPAPVPPKKDLYWQAPLRDERYMDYYRQYESFDDLLLYKNPKEYQLGSGHLAQGSGMVVYKNNLYYNLLNSRNIRKVDINTNGIVLTKDLPGAAFNNRFSYSGSPWQDIDLAVDESGLWAIYATEESTGNIVISKLNETTLNVEKTWVTQQYKPAASNAFIVCGVLYVTKTVTTRHEEIFYMYDTKTNQDTKISIPFKKMMEYVHGVNYNPPDHKLYVYNDGYLINYDLSFYPKNTNL
ncbi:olfactomedin-4-like [Polyodon spathula]|uniref:olfactomedin-4-like n=1 Tax=Polyodon spathula TaxID=7913 RepID=UPI001B7EEA70|nr:olfactomedin-4-like [Polyodon spathula]